MISTEICIKNQHVFCAGKIKSRIWPLVLTEYLNIESIQDTVSSLIYNLYPPQSTEGPYLDHGETTNEPIEKVYVTTLVTTMGLFKYVDGGNSKITPKK